MRLVDADALKDDLNELRKSPWFNTNVNGLIETTEYKARNEALNIVEELIMDPAQTVDPKQNIIVIPPELIKQLSEIVADSFNKIPWSEALEAYKTRPHGEWLELETNPPDFFGHRFYSCSKCGREIDVMTPEESLHDYPYCHCGACMIKEAENETDRC